MTEKGWIFEIVLMNERRDILGHGYVVMARGVRRFTVVAKILHLFSTRLPSMYMRFAHQSEHMSPQITS